jgi:transglutaminase-like putative cysteine protease
MMDRVRARIVTGPREGWLTLVLVALLAVSVAWSLDDAALVLGQGTWTDFLAWAALGGVLMGFLGARVGWNRPMAHTIAAVAAGLIVPLMVGSVLLPHASWSGAFHATADSVTDAVIDFAVLGLPVTRQSGHYLLVLGLLCWANGQFAASAVFRSGRPIGPIVVLGAVLVANMSATQHDQIWFIVLFSLAALFLLIRLHALEERTTWIRRRIGDPAVVGSLYLRGGTVFVGIAVFFAFVLTATAHSAPLAGFWDDAKPALVDISQWLQRLVPAAPDSRTLGVPSFGGQVTIGGLWTTSNDPALEIDRAAGDKRDLYWRATTYDAFTLTGWTTTTPQTEDRPAGEDLLAGTLDAIPASSVRAPSTFRVIPQSSLFHVVFSPTDPLSVDRDATLHLSGADGYVQSIEVGRGAYTLQASIPTVADVPGGVTQNRLRAAGTSYPPGITARYLAVPKGALGPAATQLFNDIMATVKAGPTQTPFDIAQAIVNRLRVQPFHYETNVLRVCDKYTSIVECFAAEKQGFCEHYATTMAILLRNAGVPARLVEGFLPGDLDPATGKEEIRTGGAHAWVEVYFPGYGWQMFDPTGPGVSRTDPLPAGKVVPMASATPAPTFNRSSDDPADDINLRSRRPGGVGAGSTSGGSNLPGLIIVSVVLLGSVLLLAFLAWRRGPRSATGADAIYTSVTGIARRFGFGPRPTQTAFEYAAALGDVLPNVRPELQTVATAKVEVAYGRRELGEDRIRTLGASYRRLRVALLRLAFRRGDRKRMKGS